MPAIVFAFATVERAMPAIVFIHVHGEAFACMARSYNHTAFQNG